MPQDAFHIRRLCKELNALLQGGKLNRISQVDKDELTFIIYTGKSTVKLVLSTNASNARVCLSKTEKEPAAIAPNFCMLLRKHLQGAEILKIEQKDFERIVEITLKCTSDFSECERVLHCELMGKYSNIVLSEKGIVLGALKTTALLDESHRVLLAGARYEYPAPQDKISPFDGAGMRSMEESFYASHPDGYENEELARFLFERVSGLALPTAREIVFRAMRAKMPLWAFIGEFCENAPCEPCLKMENGVPCDFFAFPVAGGESMPSLCKAEDEFYSYRENKKGFEDKKRRLESELLTANLYRIEKGMRHIELENWYDPDCKAIKIALDPLLSPAKNAQKYFKAYNKQKRAKEVLAPMQKAEEAEIDYVDSVLAAIGAADSLTDFKEIEKELIEVGALRAPKARAGGKKKEENTPFREYEHNGMKILLGRNNLQNDKLLRLASPDDIWLHTQKYHSSHAIIFTDGRQVLDETLLYAAELCAYYSDGRNGDKIPVDYCKRKFVKKPSKSKAGFVVYTDYKTLLVTPKNH